MRIRPAQAIAGLAGIAAIVLGAAAPAEASTSHPPAVHQQAGKAVAAPPPNSPGIGLGAAVAAKPPHAARSNVIRPQTNGYSVTLAGSALTLWPTQYVTLTATANADVGPTPYYIRIYGETYSGYPVPPGSPGYIATCSTGATCTVSVTEPIATHQIYFAFIANGLSDYPPGDLQATSAPVDVQWLPMSVSLAASPTTLAVGGAGTVTATASTDVGPTPFYIELFDATAGTFLTDCGSGTTCAVSVSQSAATTHSYLAYLSSAGAALPPPNVQAASSAGYVTWSDAGWQVTLSGPLSTTSYATYTATTNMDVGPTPFDIFILDEDTGQLLASCESGTTCSADFFPPSNGNTLIAFVAYASTTIQMSTVAASSNTLRPYQRPIP